MTLSTLAVLGSLARAAQAITLPLPVELFVAGLLLLLLILREVYRAYRGTGQVAELRMLDIAVRSLMIAFVIVVGGRALEHFR
jgi:hypothetical protein